MMLIGSHAPAGYGFFSRAFIQNGVEQPERKLNFGRRIGTKKTGVDEQKHDKKREEC
jgi:hypothetical protein